MKNNKTFFVLLFLSLIYTSTNLLCMNFKVKTPKKTVEPKIELLYKLFDACKKGELENVKYLIKEKGAKIDAQTNSGHQPIHTVCQFGQLNILKYLIQKGANINAKNKNEAQPIHYACQFGHLDILKYLIENGANINAKNKIGVQPIHYACQFGHLDIVKSLIEKGANINAKDKNGLQPIHLAFLLSHLDIVKSLIEKGANINAKNNNDTQPIHIACRFSHLDIVKSLIEKGANINAKNKNGLQPIHIACRFSHLDIVKSLIEKGANINAKNKIGVQPIHLAFRYGSLKIVKYLIEKNYNKIEDLDHKIDFDETFFKNHDLVKLILEEIKKRELKPYSIKDRDNKTLIQGLIENPNCITSILSDNQGNYNALCPKVLRINDYPIKSTNLICDFLMKTLKTCKNQIENSEEIIGNNKQIIPICKKFGREILNIAKIYPILLQPSSMKIKLNEIKRQKINIPPIPNDCAAHIMSFYCNNLPIKKRKTAKKTV